MPRVRVGDVELFYEWTEPDRAGLDRVPLPVVVLCNGLLTDTSSWRPTVTALRATGRYRVLTYDCRGQGQSDKPSTDGTGYPPRLHARDLESLLDYLGVTGAHFVGLSSGGCIVLQAAADRPGLAHSLIVVSAYARVDAALSAKLQSWVSAMEAGGAPLRFDVATPYVWGETHLEKNYEALKPFRNAALGISMEPAINLIRGAMDYDVSARLPQIDAPALVVTGDEDILTTRRHWEELLAGLPHAEHAVMAHAGHAALLEQPEVFNQMALSFLARVNGAVQAR